MAFLPINLIKRFLKPSGPPHTLPNNRNNVKADINDRTKKIALDVLKGVGAVILGALFTAMAVSGFGATIIIISTLTGAVAAGIIYTTAYFVMRAAQKHGYPLFPHRRREPIELENWLNAQNEAKIPQIIEKWDKEDWFQTWLVTTNQTKESAPKFLWKKLQKGVCHGEAVALAETSINKPGTSVDKIFNGLKAKKVVRHQILELIRTDLTLFKRSVGALDNQLPKVDEQIILHLNDLETFNKFKGSFSKDLSSQKDKRYVGVIQLQSTTKSHSFFVQFTPEFVVYDGLGKKFNGYHDQFANYKEGLQALYAHLSGYHSKWRPFGLKFTQATLKLYEADMPPQPVPPLVPVPPVNQPPQPLQNLLDIQMEIPPIDYASGEEAAVE